MMNNYGNKLSLLTLTGLLMFGYPGMGIGMGTGGEKIFKPPFNVPFDVATAGNQITLDFKITEALMYTVGLEYPFEKGEVLEVWRLAGGKITDQSGNRIEPGAPIILHVTIMQRDSKTIIIDKEVSSPRLSSSGGDLFEADIINLKLSPGQYRITVESKKNAPELKTVKTRLCITRAHVGK